MNNSAKYEYEVIGIFDPLKDYGTHIPKRFSKILALMNQKGKRYTHSNLATPVKTLLPKQSSISLQSTLSHSFKIGVDLGILKRHENENVIPDWFKKLETICYWQTQLRGSKLTNITKGKKHSTKSLYLYHVWNFNRWLAKKQFDITTVKQIKENVYEQRKEKTSFENIEKLLDVLSNPLPAQSSVIKIVKSYLYDEMHNNKSSSYMKTIRSSLLSYFEKNDHPISFKYDPKSRDTLRDEDGKEEQSMSLPEFLEILTVGKPSLLQKAVFLCKFHRGLDVSTLVDKFNFEAWGQLVDWFKTEQYNLWDLDRCPVPIRLVRIKTGFAHVGFLDRDAIVSLQRYLKLREEKTGNKMDAEQPLFINKFNSPITPSWVFTSFFKLAKRSGVLKQLKNSSQYNVDSHELRDLLKSTLIDCGCRIDVADHVIGHKPKDGYEKQAMLYPETLQKEYAKASKKINLFTRFSSVVSGTDDISYLKAELSEKIKKLDRLEDLEAKEKRIIQRDRLYMTEQEQRMSEMEDVIQQLKDEISLMRSGEKEMSLKKYFR